MIKLQGKAGSEYRTAILVTSDGTKRLTASRRGPGQPQKKCSVKGIDFEFVMLVICFILKIKTETWFQRFRRGIMAKTSVCVICII